MSAAVLQQWENDDEEIEWAIEKMRETCDEEAVPASNVRFVIDPMVGSYAD